MWTMIFQMFMLDLEKVEEPEIKLLTSVGSSKKQGSSRKTSTSALLAMPKPIDCVVHNKLWKILQETGIPDHLTCPLRNMYGGQEATVRTGHGTTDSFQTGKGVCQGYILSRYLFNLHAEFIMWNSGWMNHKLDSRLSGGISITSDMKWHHPHARSWRGTKESLDESERGEWKSLLKTQHSKLTSRHLVPSLHGK